MAKGLDSKVKAGDELSRKYYGTTSYTEIGLLDIIDWAHRGLLEAMKSKPS